MNQPIDRIEKLETRVTKLEQSRLSDDFLLKDIVHKATITQGLMTQALSELSDFKQAMQERLSRLDDRVTGAHTELAEMRLAMATKDDISALKGDISVLKGDISALKGDISALKGDISALETTQDARFERIEATQDARFERIEATQDARFERIETTQERQERLLQEILDRLPSKQ